MPTPPLLSLGQHASNAFGNSSALTALLAMAAAGGGAGGYLSSQSPGPHGETPEARRKRILMNTLGGAAGGVGLGATGLMGKELLTNEPGANPPSHGLGAGMFSPLGRMLSGTVGGAAGALLGGRKDTKNILSDISAAKLPEGSTLGDTARTSSGTTTTTPYMEGPTVAGQLRRNPAGLENNLQQLTLEGKPLAASSDEARRMIRTFGTPANESPFVADLKRWFTPHGAGGDSQAWRGMNRRFTGGAVGTAAGVLAPEIGRIGGKVWDGFFGGGAGDAPADPGFWSAPIGYPH